MTGEKNAIILDLDETIGHFSQIYVFWCLLKVYINDNNINWKNILFILFDMFPYIFRPEIFEIFKLIMKNKQNNKCNYVCIYTNNNGPYFWVEFIKSYIHIKLNYNLIDKIIRAFIVGNRVIEQMRTNNNKTFSDLINCTKLPKNTRFCYIDDTYYPDMIHDNIVYLKIEPYVYEMSYIEMANIFYNNNKKLFKNNKAHFIKFIKNELYNTDKNYAIKNKTNTELNIDRLVSNKIYNHLIKFFNNKNKTLKNKQTNNKTKKYISN